MTLETLETYCLSKNGAVKEFPFGNEHMVFKVMGKLFAIISIEENPLHINLKATPEDCIVYRHLYACVIPGYHMNKTHWNTVILDGCLDNQIVLEMIDESYALIVGKLTKRQREELSLLSI